MTTAVILGIDPGKLGALAAISVTGELMWVEDMPTAAKEVSAALLAVMLRELGLHSIIIAAAVEEVSAHPVTGSIGNFKLGQAHGKLLGVVATLGVPVLRPSPSSWKRAMHLSADKDVSRRLAIDTWPTWAPSFALKKHDGRAEAAILALWALRSGNYATPAPELVEVPPW